MVVVLVRSLAHRLSRRRSGSHGWWRSSRPSRRGRRISIVDRFDILHRDGAGALIVSHYRDLRGRCLNNAA
jgi:hypothetical protein